MVAQRCSLALAMLFASSPESDANAVTVEQVHAGWRARAQNTRYLHVTYQFTTVVPRGSYREKPADDTILRRNIEYALSGERAMFYVEGDQWDVLNRAVKSRKYRKAFNGETVRSITTIPGTISPFAEIYHENSPRIVYREISAAPLTWVYRPLAHFEAGGGDEAWTWSVDESTLVERPPGLVSIALTEKHWPIVHYFWVDPDREYIPVRWIQERAGKIAHDESIEFREDKTYGWVPAQWSNRRFREDTLVEFSEAVVGDIRVNEPLSGDMFNVQFPIGAWVNEHVSDGETKTFVVMEGSNRYLSREEANFKKYKELMGMDGPVRTGPRWYIVLLLALGCGGAMLLLLLRLWPTRQIV